MGDLKQAFNSVDIEKHIKSKVNKPMTKGSRDLCVGYLAHRHMRSLELGNQEMAEAYLNLIDAIEKTYNKYKDIKKPFELDESKVIDYLT